MFFALSQHKNFSRHMKKFQVYDIWIKCRKAIFCSIKWCINNFLSACITQMSYIDLKAIDVFQHIKLVKFSFKNFQVTFSMIWFVTTILDSVEKEKGFWWVHDPFSVKQIANTLTIRQHVLEIPRFSTHTRKVAVKQLQKIPQEKFKS